ncbi:MAG: hypothetical protein ACO1N8_00680 [Methylophilus sp.]
MLMLDYLWAFLAKISIFSKSSNATALLLSNKLYQWNSERIAIAKLNGNTQELTIQDIDFIKEKIQIAIKNASIKHPDTFSDQILFLSIGAIQIQAQTGSDRAWSLVKQAINNHFDNRSDKRIFSFSTLAVISITCVYMMTNTQLHTIKNPQPSSAIESPIGATDPVTISMLQLAYQKMKSGTCQLPQAAMLPAEQRMAFLMFVNKGSIDVNHVEDLRLALGYVNCLYPQELMRPQLPD